MFEYKFKNNFIILLKYIIKYKKNDLQKKYVSITNQIILQITLDI